LQVVDFGKNKKGNDVRFEEGGRRSKEGRKEEIL
jgi:hypothetical protein